MSTEASITTACESLQAIERLLRWRNLKCLCEVQNGKGPDRKKFNCAHAD